MATDQGLKQIGRIFNQAEMTPDQKRMAADQKRMAAERAAEREVDNYIVSRAKSILLYEASGKQYRIDKLNESRHQVDDNLIAATESVAALEDAHRAAKQTLIKTLPLTIPAAAAGAVWGGVVDGVKDCVEVIGSSNARDLGDELFAGFVKMALSPVILAITASAGAFNGARTVGLKALDRLSSARGEKNYFDVSRELDTAKTHQQQAATSHAGVYADLNESLPGLVETHADLTRAVNSIQTPDDIKGILTATARRSDYEALESKINLSRDDAICEREREAVANSAERARHRILSRSPSV